MGCCPFISDNSPSRAVWFPFPFFFFPSMVSNEGGAKRPFRFNRMDPPPLQEDGV